MSARHDSWRDTFRALGESLIEVLRAELAVIGETWQRSGRELGKVLAVVVAAGWLGLICLPSLLLFALLTGLHSGLEWPLWGAALAVAGVVALTILVLALIAVYLMKHRFESPVATVRHRLADHRAWWSERVLTDGSEEGESDETLDTGD